MTVPRKASAADSLPPERASLVDVFENFLGIDITRTKDLDFGLLSKDQASELVALVDIFLEAASAETFADDAITLDGFASPIVLPHDRTEPRTTRRAKQVALAHSEVVIPLQEFSQDYSRYGCDHLSSLCQWSRQNEKLLRSHVFSLTRVPELLDEFDVEQVTELADFLMKRLTEKGHETELTRLLPDWQSLSPEALLTALSPIVYSTMQDASASAMFGTGISFTQEAGGRLYQFCAETLDASSPPASPLFSHTALLRDLELPSIDNLADADFVGIRLDSEDFGQFREVLRRSLEKTAQQVEAGKTLDTAFRGQDTKVL